jgi:tetrapyrrole methylase family protein / MazG family protein
VKRQSLDDLKNIMRQLRGPNGCPWDKQQTPESLTPFAVEEALELEDAILHKKSNDVMEELGDLLFQVVFQSQMAEEKGEFSLDDVIHHLSAKMIERHPHVFAKGKKLNTSQEVLQTWEKNKNKKLSGQEIFTLPTNFPSLLAAVKIGKKTRTIDFDWKNVKDTFVHFLSEVTELGDALSTGTAKEQEEELGDTLFTLAQVARHMRVDPEKSLRKANNKVVARIHESHALSGLSWEKFSKLSQKEKDALWNKVKTKKIQADKPKKALKKKMAARGKKLKK